MFCNKSLCSKNVAAKLILTYILCLHYDWLHLCRTSLMDLTNQVKVASSHQIGHVRKYTFNAWWY